MKKEKFYSSSAWKYFRMFILLYHSKDGKHCQCSTCNKWMRIGDNSTHVGHYIKVYDGNSTNFNTAFNERNVLPQCFQCNRYGGGKQHEMSLKLKELFGVVNGKEYDIIGNLAIASKQWKKLDKVELDYYKDKYKEKIEQLKKRRGWD